MKFAAISLEFFARESGYLADFSDRPYKMGLIVERRFRGHILRNLVMLFRGSSEDTKTTGYPIPGWGASREQEE